MLSSILTCSEITHQYSNSECFSIRSRQTTWRTCVYRRQMTAAIRRIERPASGVCNTFISWKVQRVVIIYFLFMYRQCDGSKFTLSTYIIVSLRVVNSKHFYRCCKQLNLLRLNNNLVWTNNERYMNRTQAQYKFLLRPFVHEWICLYTSVLLILYWKTLRCKKLCCRNSNWSFLSQKDGKNGLHLK